MCVCELLDCGKSFEEAFDVGGTLIDASLLEHDFCDPDGVGVGGASPREVACLGSVPGHDFTSEGGFFLEDGGAIGLVH